MLEVKELNKFRKALRTAMTFQPSRRETLEAIMDAFDLTRQDLQDIIDNDECDKHDTTTIKGQAQSIAYAISVKCDKGEEITDMDVMQDLADIAYSVAFATTDKRSTDENRPQTYRRLLTARQDTPMPIPVTAEDAARLVAQSWAQGCEDYWHNPWMRNLKPNRQ